MAWPAAVMPRSVTAVPLWPKLVSMLPGVPPAANAGWVTPADASEAMTTAAAARMPFHGHGGSLLTARAGAGWDVRRNHGAEFLIA